RARPVPKGSNIRAAHNESLPNRVRYQGAPAPTNTASRSLGVVSRRASRSDSDASTQRASRESGAVTVGRLHGTGPSTPVTAGRRSSKSNLQETDTEPWAGTVTFQVRVTSSATAISARSEEHTSELQSRENL